MTNDLRARFENVYQSNAWGDEESVSGWGSRSDSHSVLEALQVLQKIVSEYNINTMADIPCGDFNWMCGFLKDHPAIDYRGFDIVPALIERNNKRFSGYKFEEMNITEEFPPKVDMIFCKDLLNHLMYKDIASALRNMKLSGAHYILISNNFGWDNVELHENVGGASRHLDICAAPFFFPPPLWNTSYLGLWDMTLISEDYFAFLVESFKGETAVASLRDHVVALVAASLAREAKTTTYYIRWMQGIVGPAK